MHKTDISYLILRSTAAVVLSVGLSFAFSTGLFAATARPQVLIAIGNSQSMDGDLSGAIMTGSGALSSGLSSLSQSSSPIDYTVPSGFAPPIQAANGSGQAPYTINNGGILYDNSASRLNVAKSGILSILQNHLPDIDFALADYNAGNIHAYTTWVYYMSPASGDFAFANSKASGNRYVANPCYQYSSASTSVDSYCNTLANRYGSSTLSSNQYMQIGASSDDNNINDVLYSGSGAGLYVDYNGPHPSSPFPPNFSLGDYHSGNILIRYYNSIPSVPGNALATGPTNAGYVPYSQEVMYAQRGFGYYAFNVNPTSGNTLVDMTALSASPSSTEVASGLASFTPFLQPETNSTQTSEIKASAYQSPLAGLLSYANSYLSGITPPLCSSGQYVVLVTDGLPTMDLNGNAWPPLGTISAQNYGVSATFNADGSMGSTNDQALIDTINAITTLKNNGIKTYIIGLGAGVDATVNPQAAATLTAMAIAGGTQTAYTANSAASFLSSFQQIINILQGNVITAAPTTPGQIKPSGSNYAYTPVSDNTSGSMQGHLYANPLNADGTVNSAIVWDAATPYEMNNSAANREASLFSADPSGQSSTTYQLTPWASLPPAVFASTGSPSAADISAYTVDPNYNNGQYLAGRSPGSLVGTMTSQAAKPQYVTAPNNPWLLPIAGYATYAQASNSRKPSVLWSADDGFLYSSDAITGQLNFGFMLPTSLSDLKNYTTFEASKPMNGGFVQVDSLSSNGGFHSFIVGTAQSGAVHYLLQLKDNSTALSSTAPIVIDQQSGMTSPQASAPAIWWDATGIAYAVYFTVPSSGSSYLNVLNLATGTVTQKTLNFTPSSPLAVDQSTGIFTAGGTDGKIYAFDTYQGVTADKIASDQHIIGTMTPQFAAVYTGYQQTAFGSFIWATSSTSITVFEDNGASWVVKWTTQDGGPSTERVNNKTTTYSNDPGTQGNGPQFLPASGTITDASTVVNGTLIVPVKISGSSNSCTAATAMYYFFQLSDGAFSTGIFTTVSGHALTNNVVIGFGIAYSPVVSMNPSQNRYSIYGSSQQNSSGNSQFNLVANASFSTTSGIVGWRPLLMTEP